MTAQIIDGKALSLSLREFLKTELEQITAHKRPACLAVVLVGENPASQVYVRNKIKACESVGIRSIFVKFPEDLSQAELLKELEKLNTDDSVDGILVQMPLPSHMDEERIIETIRADKDVDGFHCLNAGALLTGLKGFRSCTPAGVIRMLESVDFPFKGANALVIGRSNIVGKPMALMLLEKDATVTVAHSKTKNLKDLCLSADLIVAAAGRPKMLTADMVKPGAAVIDVGINRDESGKLCGDADTEGIARVAAYISPVPGGVGPMTIAMLLSNTVEAYKKHMELQ